MLCVPVLCVCCVCACYIFVSTDNKFIFMYLYKSSSQLFYWPSFAFFSCWFGSETAPLTPCFSVAPLLHSYIYIHIFVCVAVACAFRSFLRTKLCVRSVKQNTHRGHIPRSCCARRMMIYECVDNPYASHPANGQFANCASILDK